MSEQINSVLVSKSDPVQSTLRRGTPSDLDAIVRLEREAFSQDRIARRSFARLLRSPSASLLVAADGDGVQGCAVVLFRSYSRRCRLYSLAVAKEARGKGLGRTLLALAEREAVEWGCETIGLEVREDNQAAINLYAHEGYELLGATQDYYSDGTAAQHFRKSLPKAVQR